MPKDVFRVVVDSTDDDEVEIRLENRKSKKQWQETFSDFSGFGPFDIPDAGVVIALLKRGFDYLAQRSSENWSETVPLGDVRLDCTWDEYEGSANALSLNLIVSVGGGVWMPEFSFLLPFVELEHIDILESKVRDAESEIKELKLALAAAYLAKSEPPFFLSLTTDPEILCCEKTVAWSGMIAAEVHSHFSVSGDGTRICVLNAGLYQITVRLLVTSNSGDDGDDTPPLQLLVNGTTVAKCFQADESFSKGPSTIQLIEVLKLQVEDTVEVLCGGEEMLVHSVESNRFTITMLH